MTDHDCADCGARPATVFLPEGRYLCHDCWIALRDLRQYVLTDTARRTQRRAKLKEGSNR